jgi:hypothetical protein
MSFYRFDSQFRETEYERQQRWKETKRKRIAEGKCWQCAKPIAECDCPNVDHSKAHAPSTSQNGGEL